MFAASPAPIMEVLRPPPLVDSIMGAEEVANIAKTQANAYKLFVCLGSLAIFPYSPYIDPGAMHLAKCAAPLLLRIWYS